MPANLNFEYCMICGTNTHQVISSIGSIYCKSCKQFIEFAHIDITFVISDITTDQDEFIVYIDDILEAEKSHVFTLATKISNPINDLKDARLVLEVWRLRETDKIVLILYFYGFSSKYMKDTKVCLHLQIISAQANKDDIREALELLFTENKRIVWGYHISSSLEELISKLS